MGYYFQNEPKNIHNTIKNYSFITPKVIPWGRTDKRTNGQTNEQTDRWTNICSLFRDKLSLPEGSSDCFGSELLQTK